MTITKALYNYLDSFDEQVELSGWQIFDAIRDVTGKNTYPSTLLQMCREYADITGADFICINNQKSLYRFTPNIKLGNAIIEGKE